MKNIACDSFITFKRQLYTDEKIISYVFLLLLPDGLLQNAA